MVRRGDVFFCNLDPVFGHEQQGSRPVVVLQNNLVNERLKTVLIAPLTTKLKARGYLLTVFVDAEQNGLDRYSVVLLFQIRTLDKRRLERKVAHLSDDVMSQIDNAIRIAFDLS